MLLNQFLNRLANEASPEAESETPVVIMIGTLPHTVLDVELERHEDGGSTIWITAEES